MGTPKPCFCKAQALRRAKRVGPARIRRSQCPALRRNPKSSPSSDIKVLQKCGTSIYTGSTKTVNSIVEASEDQATGYTSSDT